MLQSIMQAAHLSQAADHRCRSQSIVQAARLSQAAYRQARCLSDAMNRPAEKPGRDSTRPSRTPVCLGKLSTANPERVALALCRAWPRLAWPNQGISSCRRRPVRDGIMTTVILYLRSPSTLRCRGYTISEVCSAQGIETADKRHQWGPPLLQSALYEDNKGSKRAALRHASVRARARHRNIP